MRWLALLLTLAGCGLPGDIVGPVDPGPNPPPMEKCPTPAPGSGIETPVC